MLIELILLCATAAFLYKWYFGKRPNFPHGPRGLPLIGTWFKNSDVFEEFDQYSKRYGPVFSYSIFGTDVVVLNDHESVREILVKQGDKVRDRPLTKFAQEDFGGNYGLLAENGDIFTEQRRFALSTLRDFGFGKPVLEDGIIQECQKLIEVDKFKKHSLNCVMTVKPVEGKILVQDAETAGKDGLNLTFYLNSAVSNVINKVIFGRRFDYSDKEFFDHLDLLNTRAQAANFVISIGIRPWMVNLVPQIRNKIRGSLRAGLKIRKYLQTFINEEKSRALRDHSSSSTPETYVDAFARMQAEGKGSFFTDHQLSISVEHLFGAGTETTSTTIRWAILYLLRHPEIQEKVFQEIKEVVGLDRYPSVGDRQNLPYTEATILETQRIGRLVALFGRKINEPLQYQLYRFPVGTMILLNISALHMDPTVWTDPTTFRPERFLTSEAAGKGGRTKIDRERAELLYAFGGGKRRCLGESLARMELFLFFTTLIQRLQFSLPPGAPLPDTKPIFGVTSSTKPFKTLINQRSEF